MQIARNTLATFLVSLIVLTGCVKREPTATHPTQTSTTPAPATTPSKSPLPLVSPVYPGAYKTVEINGVECRQGRSEPGKFGGTFVRSIVGSEPKVFNPWTSSDTQSTEF